MSEIPVRFQLGLLGVLLLLRSLPGLLAIMLAASGRITESAVSLIVATLLDVVVDSLATRLRWARTPGQLHIEGFVDFTCFVWAPVQIALAVSTDWVILASAGVFVLAGGFRLARFNVLGTSRGGYLGLPVTYSGVVVPIVVLVVMPIADVGHHALLLAAFLVLSLLMISRRFITPRVSI